MTALDGTEVQCWKCARPVPPPDEDRRYCRRCGAQLYQRCPYDPGHGVSVYANVCPVCGRPFRYCPVHRLLYSLDAEGCTQIEGCDAVLCDSTSGHTCAGVDARRTRSVRDDLAALRASDPWRHAGAAPISSPVSRHGYVFYGTNQSQVRAVSLHDRNTVWSAAAGRSLDRATIVVCSDRVCSAVGNIGVRRSTASAVENSIYVHGLMNGDPVCEIQLSDLSHFQIVPVGSRLAVVGRDPQGRDVLRCHQLSGGSGLPQHRVSTQAVGPPSGQPIVPPVADGSMVWFIDSRGQLESWDLSSQQPVVRLAELRSYETTQFSLVEEQSAEGKIGPVFFFAAGDSSGQHVLMWWPERSDSLRPAVDPLQQRVRLLATCYPYIVLALDDVLQIYHVERRRQPISTLRLPSNAVVIDLLLVSVGQRLYLVYILAQQVPSGYSAQWVEAFVDPPRPRVLRTGDQGESPSLLFIAKGTVVAERMSGNVFWFPQPPD